MYELALPLEFLHMYGIFHVFMLQKYMQDPSRVLSYEPLQVQKDLSYEE